MTADQINAVACPIVYLLLITLTAAMAWRVARHVRNGWRRTPLLLARDLSLFSYLVVSVAVTQYARANGMRLATEVWWVLLTDSLVIAVLGFWNLIEYGFIRQRRTRPQAHLCPHCGGTCDGGAA